MKDVHWVVAMAEMTGVWKVESSDVSSVETTVVHLVAVMASSTVEHVADGMAEYSVELMA